jgi:Rad3-related DNA helicase
MADWRPYFPLDSAPREGQIRAIDEILEGFDKGHQTYLLDAPTGSGKSAIAVTIARYMAAQQGSVAKLTDAGAYFLTTQKILQEQYLRDFELEAHGGMVELKSSTNYTCGYDERQSCGESKRALAALGKNADGTNWKRHCTQSCVYNDAKRRFMNGLLGITNYSFFLAETTYVGKLEPREFLVCDECHNVESEICKFVEVEVTDRFCKKHLGINLSSYDDPDQLFKWMSDKYKPALGGMIEQVKKSLSLFKDNDGSFGNDETFKTLVKQNDLLDKHICKVNRFIDRFQPEAWIVNRDKRKDHRGDRVSLTFKPIDAVTWSEASLLRFGDKRLLMSATVLDKTAFCRSLGLDESKTGYMALPSSFPAENRPIHYLPVGKMSMKELDDTLPRLAEAVKELLKAHHDQKGIIHCVNFRVANYLRDVLNDPRILTHTSENRDTVLKYHQESKEPTVLCSPSMMEGVDLAGDLARFAIIAKIPYPSLGDKALKKRIARDPWYYDYLTTRSFVQALGRSVRSETDTCTLYVLDECFSAFRGKNKRTIPDYVQEALK